MVEVAGGGLQELNSTEALAKHTGISIPTLNRWRAEGRGPKFVKLGHAVRYPRRSIEQWIEESFAEAG